MRKYAWSVESWSRARSFEALAARMQQQNMCLSLLRRSRNPLPLPLLTHPKATFVHALGKLRMLQGKSRSLDTRKLFTMSVVLLCLARTMGFVTIGALNMQSVDFDDGGGAGGSSLTRRSPSSSSRNDADERFYEKTMMVRAVVAHGLSLSWWSWWWWWCPVYVCSAVGSASVATGPPPGYMIYVV